jgi:hypothetical protein
MTDDRGGCPCRGFLAPSRDAPGSRPHCRAIINALITSGNYRGNYSGDGRSKFKFKLLSSFQDDQQNRGFFDSLGRV